VILVIGSVVVRAGHVEEALALSRQHVTRSRTEPGCISHDVHRDADNSDRLVFVERWSDHPALLQHFAVPESSEFVQAVTALAEQRPSIEIFDATEL
jgi:quinol monooxygenase YgiN